MKRCLAVPLLLLLAAPETGVDPHAQAVADYRAGRYGEALQAFRALVADAGEDAAPELLGNLALAALRQRRPGDAEPAAARLLELDDAGERALGEFLLGQAAFERAALAELAASLPDAEPDAWQEAVDRAQAALRHWRSAARLRAPWPAAVRNAERASRRLDELRKKRDEAEQDKKSEPAPEQRPPAPAETEEPAVPEVVMQPLPPGEVDELLERLRQKEREKRLLRRVTNRTNRVGERDW